MQLYPAIDMKGGKCVLLTQVRFYQRNVDYGSPAEMAKLWVSKGARLLHNVDLDGALAGYSVNEAAIKTITECVDIPVQLGGGIRTREAVAHMLDLGISEMWLLTQ